MVIIVALCCSSREDSCPQPYKSDLHGHPDKIQATCIQCDRSNRMESGSSKHYISTRSRGDDPPPGRIRKIISIRIRSESDCDDVELADMGVSGVSITVSVQEAEVGGLSSSR